MIMKTILLTIAIILLVQCFIGWIFFGMNLFTNKSKYFKYAQRTIYPEMWLGTKIYVWIKGENYTWMNDQIKNIWK